MLHDQSSHITEDWCNTFHNLSIYSMHFPKATLTIMTLWLRCFTSIIFLYHFSPTERKTPNNCSVLLPVPINLHCTLWSLFNHLAFTSHLVSCTQQKSNHLLSIISAISSLCVLIVPTFAKLTWRPMLLQGFHLLMVWIASLPPWPNVVWLVCTPAAPLMSLHTHSRWTGICFGILWVAGCPIPATPASFICACIQHRLSLFTHTEVYTVLRVSSWGRFIWPIVWNVKCDVDILMLNSYQWQCIEFVIACLNLELEAFLLCRPKLEITITNFSLPK